jgi:hypothetical protein
VLGAVVAPLAAVKWLIIGLGVHEMREPTCGRIGRSATGGLMAKVSMDILIEALFQAVLSEENKPLSARRRQVKDRILEAEGAIRQWTKPKLSDPNNERVLAEFRERLRQRLERGTTQAIGGTANYLIDVLRILAETDVENFNPPRQAELKRTQ